MKTEALGRKNEPLLKIFKFQFIFLFCCELAPNIMSRRRSPLLSPSAFNSPPSAANEGSVTTSGRKRKFTRDGEDDDENEQGYEGGAVAFNMCGMLDSVASVTAIEDAASSASAAASASSAPPAPPTADDELFNESEALALQFMREEEEAHMARMMELQRMSLQRAMSSELDHDDGFEGEEMDPDLAFALRLQREEGEAVHGGAMGEEGELLEEGEEGAAAEIDVDEMTYDELLELGAHIGDVAKERWQQRAAGVIKEIPIVVWEASGAAALAERCGQTGEMCVVCQCDYEENDTLKVLRCSHCFHGDCVDRWLADNKSCPMCKMSCAASPPPK